MSCIFALIFCIMLTGCSLPATMDHIFDTNSSEEVAVERINEVDTAKYASLLRDHPGILEDWQQLDFAIFQSLRHVRNFDPDEVAIFLPATDDLCSVLPTWESDTLPSTYAQPVPSNPGKGSPYITYGMMAKTLSHLLKLVPTLATDTNVLSRDFIWLRVTPDFRYTGYYEPILKASYKKTQYYSVPLYETPHKQSERRYSREEIDVQKKLAGKKLELAWVHDPIEAFFLQIQGSGHLIYTDGKEQPILYDAQNGHKYTSLGATMVSRNLMNLEEVTMFSLKEYLQKHPEQQQELFNTNPSYVFFRLGEEEGAGSYGSMGRVLTPRASSATDRKILPHGLLTFVNVLIPDKKTQKKDKPFPALILPQDSGGAIKDHRMDIFFGSGEDAEYAAAILNQKGSLHILIAKKALQDIHNRQIK